MNTHNQWILTIVLTVLSTTALLITAAVFDAWWLLWTLGLLCLGLLGVWLFLDKMWVRVQALNSGVVEERFSREFVEFLPPGRHFLPPHQIMTATITTAPRTVEGYCKQALTINGIPLTVNWRATVAVDTSQIAPDLQARLARALPEHMPNIVRNHGNNCIRHVVNEHDVRSLTHRGARRRLERDLRERLVRRIAPFGLQVYRIMLEEIELPTGVVKALAEAHNREATILSKAEELNKFAHVISRLPEADRRWMVQLLQTYVLGENGVTLHAPYQTIFGTGASLPESGQANASSTSGNGERPSPAPSAESPDNPYGKWPRYN